MNRPAVVSALLGGTRNRCIARQPERSLAERPAIAGRTEGLDGLELPHPADSADPGLFRSLVAEYGFSVSAISFRSRRTGRRLRGSFNAASAREVEEAVDDLQRAMDLAAEPGCHRIATCPLNDGANGLRSCFLPGHSADRPVGQVCHPWASFLLTKGIAPFFSQRNAGLASIFVTTR